MATDLSKTEYLKRYLENDKKGKRKKKPKKTSNSLLPQVKIVDINIDLKSIKFGEEEIEDQDEAPIVAEVIDERPTEIKIKELYESSRWKKLESTAIEDQNISYNNQNNSPITNDHKRHDSDSDCSLPRTIQNSQTKLNVDEDSSQLRIHISSVQVKKRRHDSDSDCSPPRHLSRGEKRHDSDSDISPPRSVLNERKRPKELERRSKNHRNRQDSDSDLSPERMLQRKNVKVEDNSGSDLSPPRENDKKYSGKDANKRPQKTLSGLKAGLQNASTLRKEVKDLRDRERNYINQLDERLSGQNAETVVRDRTTGKRRDLEEENREKLEKEKKLAEQQQKYVAWGKGTEQTEIKKLKLSEDLYESTKPIARYRDDEDLDKALKEVIHQDDPMAEFIMKKRKKENVSTMPEYKGPPPPPNRFGIRPGYRWDGVDRSNGFEKKYLASLSNKKALQDEAYMWSVQDM
ncbi:BUD13 homolog [Caerostris extrusa]|uniref:BUD13 homolog n=1 Tax=Caerostris extrusa TaxID=172846 RepID=A0AAV4RLG3_CAEEX|nr:BUD13 homolog [Caerostris extrusa]